MRQQAVYYINNKSRLMSKETSVVELQLLYVTDQVKLNQMQENNSVNTSGYKLG